VLCGDAPRVLDVSEAHRHSSRTRFDEVQGRVILGANVLPGVGMTPNARMSLLACLAHELAHAERYEMGYRRPLELPDMLLDEAETSLHASFTPILGNRDREDLVEDARERLSDWLKARSEAGI
jgi:hypothetical protein